MKRREKLFKRLHGIVWVYDTSANVETVRANFNRWNDKISEYLRARDRSTLSFFVIGVKGSETNEETVEFGHEVAQYLLADHLLMSSKESTGVNNTLLPLFSTCFKNALRQLARSFDLLAEGNIAKAAL